MKVSNRTLTKEILVCYAICILLTIVDVFCAPMGSPIADVAWLLAVGSLVLLPILAVRKIHPRDEINAGLDLHLTKRDLLFGLASILILCVPVFACHYWLETQINGRTFVLGLSRLDLLPRVLWYEALIQLFCVALPEEFFYRGYIQTALTKILGSRKKFSKFAVPLAICLSSVLFAFSHLPSGNIARLLTFFPGLLFGFLRYKSGGLWSAILCHAACNLMMYVFSVLYI